MLKSGASNSVSKITMKLLWDDEMAGDQLRKAAVRSGRKLSRGNCATPDSDSHATGPHLLLFNGN